MRLPTSRDLLARQSHPPNHISRDEGSRAAICGFGLAEKMEYPALGTVEAKDVGGARPYSGSEEREGREPDGLRFDRERACRLWEAVSGAQPVGREEGESGGRVSEKGNLLPAVRCAGSGGSSGRERWPAPGSTVTPPGSRAASLRDAPGDSWTPAPRQAWAPRASS